MLIIMEKFWSHTHDGTGLKVSRQNENWKIKCAIAGNDICTAYRISDYYMELSCPKRFCHSPGL